MMKKYIIVVGVLFMSFFFNINKILAINIDSSIPGSINGKYVYDSHIFKDKNIYLYQIADLDEKGKYTYLESYIDFPKDINKLDDKEWIDYSKDIYKYIVDNHVYYNSLAKTNELGEFSFKDLKIGLYLIVTDEVNENGYKYSSNPSLISVPNVNEDKKDYTYDLNIKMKVEETQIRKTTKATTSKVIHEEKPDVPQTSDDIAIYFGIFVVSLILLIILACYLYKLKKEK